MKGEVMPSVPEIVTGQIIDQLEKGEIPWQRPWDPEVGMPRRVPSGKPYQGINVLMLTFSSYESPFWLTLRQANSMGGHIRKGEHGRIVTFYKQVTMASADTIDGDAHSYWLLRYYRVYNAEQTEGIDKNKWPKLPERHDVEPIACCEDVVTNMPSRPPISFDGSGRAYYQPLSDSIHLPLKDAFHSSEEFYSTQFHELAHSTGHQKRLNRPDAFGNDFGSVSYSKEELVAEMASAFLCAHCGIEKTIQNSSAYIAGWLKAFRGDKRMVITAASAAHKAYNFILGLKQEGE
jgi:antirestriction protein ArdC